MYVHVCSYTYAGIFVDLQETSSLLFSSGIPPSPTECLYTISVQGPGTSGEWLGDCVGTVVIWTI